MIAYDGQKNDVSPLVICLAGPTPYESDKVVPYKYNTTMVEDDKEVPIPAFPYILNIVDVSGVTRSGQVFVVVAPKRIVNQNVDQDKVLKLIKKSNFNMVDQLFHTLSNISVLSLLMSSKAHKEAL